MNIAEWNATRLATHSCVSKSVHVARGTLRRCTESRRHHSCGGRVDARDPFRELVGMLAGPRLLGGGLFFFLGVEICLRHLSSSVIVRTAIPGIEKPRPEVLEAISAVLQS